MKTHRPKKRFGQNFLKDHYYLNLIASALNLKPEDHVVEIGPGQGALTNLLANKVAHYDAIEIDRDLAAYLEEKFKSLKHFDLYVDDVLKFDFKKIYRGKPFRVIGNLPYNISSPLLFHLLQCHYCVPLTNKFSKNDTNRPEHFGLKGEEYIQDMHFMLQLEVVNRLTAQANTKDYGRLTVMTQYFCENTLLFIVPPSAFSPSPKVQSAFIQMIPRKTLIKVKDMSVFSHIVKEAFTYRRKTLGNSLKRFITSGTLQALNIDPKRRAETLTLEEFVNIANTL